MLNSFYGGMCNRFFRFYNLEIGKSITMTGQVFIKYSERKLNEFINNEVGTKDVDYCRLIDTDSVRGDSKIVVDNKEMTIAEYFDNCSEYIKKDDFNKQYVKVGEGSTIGYKDGIITKPIKYVMKHCVKKKMYKITVDGKEVICTEDHSIIVKRNNEIISLKPEEIIESDELLYCANNLKSTTNFKIESLGIIEEDVYDIEVEDCHNFFANDILVHNSNYMDFSKVVEKYGFDIDGLDKFVQEKVEPYLDKCFKEMQEYMNHYQPVIAMKRECIADKAMFLSKKKRYALRVLDNEGLRYEHPKLKITGLEVIKSSTPAAVKKGLKGILDFVLEDDRIGLIQYIAKEKEEFMKKDLDDIAIPRSITKYDAYTEEGISSRMMENAAMGITRKIAIPIHNRAANLYNNLLDKFDLNREYQKIKSGDKIKMLFLTPDNPYGDNVIAYLDRFPAEFKLNEYIDKETIFEKMFIDIVHNITDDFNWNLIQQYTLDDLF